MDIKEAFSEFDKKLQESENELDREIPDVREALQHNYYTALKEAAREFPADTSKAMLTAYALVRSAVHHCIQNDITMYCTFSPKEGSSMATGNVLMCKQPFASELIDALAYMYDLDPEAGDKFCLEATGAITELLLKTPADQIGH